MMDNVFLEVLRPDGEAAGPGDSGEIVLTDLNNKAMPLIRYRVGDMGILGSDCACGRRGPVLEKIWGRTYDFVHGLDGRHFHGEYFMYLFEDLRTAGLGVEQFQVHQVARYRIEVRMKTAEVNSSQRDFVRGWVADTLPGIHFEFVAVDEIAREPSGKTRLIINDLTTRPPPAQGALDV